ncbi:hypothetical protein PRIPAC_90106, partial [Pristionchus pacificus]|uniref:Uncharacterized protein n=1 Tax=Pristionchus pacificus TaxID=54126 RepID=A0A2A6CVT6_PRIPA
RARVSSMSAVRSLPSRRATCVQSDPDVGVTSSDVIAFSKMIKKRPHIESHVEMRVARLDQPTGKTHYAKVASAAVNKLNSFVEAMCEASRLLHNLIAAANGRGTARLTRPELLQLQQARAAMSVARQATLRWRELWATVSIDYREYSRERIALPPSRRPFSHLLRLHAAPPEDAPKCYLKGSSFRPSFSLLFFPPFLPLDEPLWQQFMNTPKCEVPTLFASCFIRYLRAPDNVSGEKEEIQMQIGGRLVPNPRGGRPPTAIDPSPHPIPLRKLEEGKEKGRRKRGTVRLLFIDRMLGRSLVPNPRGGGPSSAIGSPSSRVDRFMFGSSSVR